MFQQGRSQYLTNVLLDLCFPCFFLQEIFKIDRVSEQSTQFLFCQFYSIHAWHVRTAAPRRWRQSLPFLHFPPALHCFTASQSAGFTLKTVKFPYQHRPFLAKVHSRKSSVRCLGGKIVPRVVALAGVSGNFQYSKLQNISQVGNNGKCLGFGAKVKLFHLLTTWPRLLELHSPSFFNGTKILLSYRAVMKLR